MLAGLAERVHDTKSRVVSFKADGVSSLDDGAEYRAT